MQQFYTLLGVGHIYLSTYFLYLFKANIFRLKTNPVIKETQASSACRKNNVANDRGGAGQADDFIRRVPAR